MIALRSIKEDVIRHTEKCIASVCSTLISIHIPTFPTNTGATTASDQPLDKHHRTTSSTSLSTAAADTASSTSSFDAFLALCKALSQLFIPFVTELLQQLYSDPTLTLQVSGHVQSLSLLYAETEEELESIQQEEQKTAAEQQALAETSQAAASAPASDATADAADDTVPSHNRMDSTMTIAVGDDIATKLGINLRSPSAVDLDTSLDNSVEHSPSHAATASE